jgi:hypothetical protein
MTTISMTTGSEGPRHDPYHYEEMTVEGRNGTIVLHSGLVTWLKHNKRTFKNEDEAVLMFEVLVGVPPHIALRAYWEVENRKAKALWRKHRHCKGETRNTHGYPGEHFMICGCGEILDYHFNRSEIE